MNNTKDRIKILLSELKMNQKEFSAFTGVDSAIICRILKGEHEISVLALRKISDTTKISPTWLLGYGNDDEIERM